VDRGGRCGSIADIDRAEPRRTPGAEADLEDKDPLIGGAAPALLEHHAGRWSAGSIAGAPVHEADQIVKVVLAPWIDRAGDFHGAAEIYAVVRKGGWSLAAPQSVRRIDLAPETAADIPPPSLAPAVLFQPGVLPPPSPALEQTKPPAPMPAPLSLTATEDGKGPPGVTVTRIKGADGRSVKLIIASTPVPNPPEKDSEEGQHRHRAHGAKAPSAPQGRAL